MRRASALRTTGVVLVTVVLWATVSVCGAATATPRHTPAPAAQVALNRAQALERDGKWDEALASGYQAVEADPEFLAAHDWLAGYTHRWAQSVAREKPGEARARLRALEPRLTAVGKAIEQKYEDWQKRFPVSLGVLYGMATVLHNQESPRARPYLLQLAERDPTNAKVFAMLGAEAAITGDREALLDYMQRAMKLEPENAEYALTYAYYLQPPKREPALLDVAKRFPNSPLGARALLVLSDETDDDTKRIQYLEQLRTQFPPDKDPGSAGGMGNLFETYLRVDPAKAVTLAQQMRATKASKEWDGRVELAQAFIEVNQKLAAGQSREALALLGKLEPEHRSANTAMLERVKARVMAEAGQAAAGYKALLKLQAKTPEDETRALLQSIGRQLHKTPQQVQADIRTTLYAGAKSAPPFDLQEYTSNGTLSLAQLRGKVVLLTFWFPACGPCALEFPHFEAVMRRFHEGKDVAFVGINVVRDQDSYVLPVIEKKGYTFTPLKGTDAVQGAAKGYAVRGAPSNFLIDRSGRIVYSGFMIDDARGELMLQRMIESVVEE